MAARLRIIGFIFLLGGYICLIFPVFSDSIEALDHHAVIRESDDYMQNLNQAEKSRMLKEAVWYNSCTAKKQQDIPFEYAGESVSDEYYDALFDENDCLGYLEIPSLDLYLPVNKGTGAGTLRHGCGHLYGTSVPIGGNNTHSVIAAHSGLAAASLFSDIDQLKAGDTFSLHVLGDVLNYRVTGIRTVLPSEEAAYLQIENGHDLVTLYTCTPKGINTHRLLVQGRRINETCEIETDNKIETVEKRAIVNLILVMAIPGLLFGLLRPSMQR